jgi:hypothetical protein
MSGVEGVTKATELEPEPVHVKLSASAMPCKSTPGMFYPIRNPPCPRIGWGVSGAARPRPPPGISGPVDQKVQVS